MPDGGDGANARPIETCGGRRCGAGEVCCFVTSSCIAEAQANSCRPAATDAGSSADASEGNRCYSNADCRASDYCFAPSCTGPGECRSRSLQCSEASPLCGCDGRDYDTVCAAAAAGVRIVTFGRCGVTPGGPDSGTAVVGCTAEGRCPTGRSCCALTSTCIPDSCRDCCTIPPPGSVTTCRTNADCPSQAYFCQLNGCDSVGGCVVRPSSTNCAGVSEPVCGCDRRTYVNACLANAAGVAVAADGMCR